MLVITLDNPLYVRMIIFQGAFATEDARASTYFSYWDAVTLAASTELLTGTAHDPLVRVLIQSEGRPFRFFCLPLKPVELFF